jgi:hypothetical protein
VSVPGEVSGGWVNDEEDRHLSGNLVANRSLGALNRIRTSAQGAPSSSGDSDRAWQLLRRGVIVARPSLVAYVAV